MVVLVVKHLENIRKKGGGHGPLGPSPISAYGFIKGSAPGKFTSCQKDLAHLV